MNWVQGRTCKREVMRWHSPWINNAQRRIRRARWFASTSPLWNFPVLTSLKWPMSTSSSSSGILGLSTGINLADAWAPTGPALLKTVAALFLTHVVTAPTVSCVTSATFFNLLWVRHLCNKHPFGSIYILIIKTPLGKKIFKEAKACWVNHLAIQGIYI